MTIINGMDNGQGRRLRLDCFNPDGFRNDDNLLVYSVIVNRTQWGVAIRRDN